MQNEQATSTVLLNGEQAKAELAELDIRAKALRKSIREAADIGDLKGVKRYNEELKEVNKSMKTVRAEAFNAKKVLDNLSGATGPELERTIKKIQSLLMSGKVKRHSQDWDELKNSLILTKKEYANLRSEMNVGESFWSKSANNMNKYFSIFTAGIAAFTGIAFGAKQMVDNNAELSDSFADVMKTTNLTRKEVEGLYTDFKSLDTRTTRKELLQLASDAGKLGIDGKKNILDFVDAGNQINVALGEDLGQDAIKNIGKMVGVFDKSTKEIQGLGLKEQMLAVGSAVNSIGQNSSASEEYLVAFAARLGGVSKQAGIGIDAILGYASALDQDMQQVEMSATALQNFIMKVMGDPAKFAKLAGVSVKEFSSLLNTDANEAIKKVLRSLHDKGGFQALIPIFQDMGADGSRAVGVLSSLAGSIDKVDKQQILANKSLIEGNSVTKEYNMRNNNLAASLSKLSQNVSAWFTNSTLTTWLGGLVSGLEKVTRSSGSATKQFDDQAEKVVKLKMKMEPLLTKYDQLATKTNRSTTENAEMKRIITEVTSVMPSATTAVDKYGNAIAISTGRVREFINAEVARYGVVNKKAIDENKDLLNDVESQLIFHKKKIDQINKTGTFITRTVTDRKSGDTYDLKANAKEVSAEQDKYRQLLQDRIGYKAEIDRLSGATLKKQIQDAENEAKLLAAKRAQEELDNKKPDFIPADKDPNKAKLEAIDKWISDEQVKLKNKRLKDEIDETSYQNKLVDITRKGLVKKQNLYKSSDKEHSEYQNQIIDIDLKRKIDANAVELKVINDAYTDRQNLITAYSRLQKKAAEKDLEDELITQDEYENKLLAIDKAEATSRLQSAKQLAASIKEFTFETEEAKKSAVENANKWIEKAEEDLANTEEAIRKKKISDEKGFQKEVADIMRKYGVNRQKEIIDEYNSDLFLLKKALDKKKLTLEQYEKAVAKIKAKVAQKNAEDIAQVASEASALSTTLQDAQLLAVENKYAKELKAAKGNAEETTKIEEKIAAEKIEVQKEYADVNFAISIAQIGANTAVAIMKALADLGPIAGPIAAGLIGLTGLAQVAVAKQQRDEVKNLWTGGFTEPGDKYKPAGIVHAGEFVANQDAVRSVPMRKVFNLIDHAQKTNTVARITPEDISRAVGMKSGYSADNYSSPGAAAGANSGSGISAEDLNAMRNTMAQTNAVNAELLKQIKQGIVAKSVISGNDGTAKKLEEYNKLISNAKG